MKDNHAPHDDHTHPEKKGEVVEAFKEEGMLTVETLDIATHDALANEHKHHASKHFKLTTPIAVLLGACIIAVSIVAYGFIIRGGGGNAPTTVFAGRSIDDSDIIEGKVKSDVIVVEYSDPECPFCVRLHPAMKELREEYGDKVAFVYRHFPLTSIHPNAFAESQAIECAGIVGDEKVAYQYIDALYDKKYAGQNPVNLAFPPLAQDGKEKIAKEIGIDGATFSSCMNDKAIADRINASINDGITSGVQGTPSTFILIKDGKKYNVVIMIDGAREKSYFKAAIDEALSR